MKKLNWLITGDKHAQLEGVLSLLRDNEDDSLAIIILGDAGFNFYLDKKEHSLKTTFNSTHNYVYCVRGNHEERPENLPDHKLIYDENVKGEVWCDEKRWPYIRYFQDGGIYEIDGRSVLVLGGAYSVDKYYRLACHYQWFKDEQLSQNEMKNISDNVRGKSFDIVLSHTCPYSWEPRDLFLSSVDQSTVDDSMELWMDKLKDEIKYNLWLFGHFHGDRLTRPHVEMMFHDVCKLDDIWDRWNNEKELPAYTLTWDYDPKYFADDNQWCEKK